MIYIKVMSLRMLRELSHEYVDGTLRSISHCSSASSTIKSKSTGKSAMFFSV